VTRHIFRPAAAADLEVIHGWYERERRGLGEEFLAEARRVVDAVVALPNGYPVIHRDTRRALVHRFPYGLLYRVVDDLVVFVGCFHSPPIPCATRIPAFGLRAQAHLGRGTARIAPSSLRRWQALESSSRALIDQAAGCGDLTRERGLARIDVHQIQIDQGWNLVFAFQDELGPSRACSARLVTDTLDRAQSRNLVD